MFRVLSLNREASRVYIMELTDEAFAKIEFQTQSIFEQAGWHVDIVTDYERVDKIVEKAMIENVVRDTSTFLFLGFGAAIGGMSSAFFGSAINSDTDYRA